jgi:methylphosphotriester-DNA--protein-cysteine methyltransferase
MLAIVQEAAHLLTTEYETSLTIAQLCRRLGTNPYTLQTAFKKTIRHPHRPLQKSRRTGLRP